MKIRRLVAAVAASLLLLVATATPAEAAVYGRRCNDYTRVSTTVRVCALVEDAPFGYVHGGVTYQRVAGGGSPAIRIDNLRSYRDGVQVESGSQGFVTVTGSVQGFGNGFIDNCTQSHPCPNSWRATVNATIRWSSGNQAITVASNTVNVG